MIIVLLGLVVAVIVGCFWLVSRREAAGDGFWSDVETGREGSLTVDLPCMAAGSYRARRQVIRTGPLYPADLPGPDRAVVQRFSNRAGEPGPGGVIFALPGGYRPATRSTLEWVQALLQGELVDLDAAVARDVAHCQRMASA